MNETYKFLKRTITRNWEDKTDEEIVKMYQENNLNELLSYEFCKYFKLIQKLIRKYGIFIEQEELSSLTLELLNKAMTKYKTDGKIKFCTFMYTVMKNGIIKESVHYEVKGCIIRNTCSYDNVAVDEENDNDKAYIEVLEDKKSNIYNTLLVEADANMNFDLNEKEKEVCRLILEGKGEDKLDIADGMKKDRITIYKYLKIIKEKLRTNELYLRS